MTLCSGRRTARASTATAPWPASRTINGFTRMTRGIARRSCQSARDKSNQAACRQRHPPPPPLPPRGGGGRFGSLAPGAVSIPSPPEGERDRVRESIGRGTRVREYSRLTERLVHRLEAGQYGGEDPDKLSGEDR